MKEVDRERNTRSDMYYCLSYTSARKIGTKYVQIAV